MIGLDGIYGTAPVAWFRPNALGIYDLGGNALEWIRDGLDEKSGHRTVRGGGWNYVGQGAETPFRWSCTLVAYDNVGLRLVRTSGF
jgi:formylglycine-generating enzyme required for sulfatase activity